MVDILPYGLDKSLIELYSAVGWHGPVVGLNHSHPVAS